VTADREHRKEGEQKGAAQHADRVPKRLPWVEHFFRRGLDPSTRCAGIAQGPRALEGHRAAAGLHDHAQPAVGEEADDLVEIAPQIGPAADERDLS
jgi:hypothetical protein